MTPPAPPDKSDSWLLVMALVLLVVALGFCGVAAYYVFSRQITLLIAVVLLVPVALSGFGAIFCAMKANPTTLDNAISAVGKLVSFRRG